MSELAIKRVYDPPSRADGFRILVDRIWPRGLRREEAAIDVWLREVAPSAGLRRWFGHEPASWPGFQDRYRAELLGSGALEHLLTVARQHERVTLVFAARDVARNNAVVLQALCAGRLGRSRVSGG